MRRWPHAAVRLRRLSSVLPMLPSPSFSLMNPRASAMRCLQLSLRILFYAYAARNAAPLTPSLSPFPAAILLAEAAAPLDVNIIFKNKLYNLLHITQQICNKLLIPLKRIPPDLYEVFRSLNAFNHLK